MSALFVSMRACLWTHDAGVSVVFTSVQVNACGTSDTGSGHTVGMNAHLTLEHLTP